MKKAIFSVSNKFGIADFAQELVALDFAILSTSGTFQLLNAQGISAQKVEDYTQTPELLGGQVKTLHPKIFAEILNPAGGEISLVVVNLYPLEKGEIDIGGNALLRAAAKNYKQVLVVCDPQDYIEVSQRLKNSEVDLKFRKQLAAKALRLTAAYDAQVATAWTEELFPERLTFAFEKAYDLSYGENPDQQAAVYRECGRLETGIQLQGKPLSFNNVLDADSAWEAVSQFSEPACVIVKHNNPCGVAVKASVAEAFAAAYAADSLCAFGGVIALNAPVDITTAKAICTVFFDLVIAPDFTREALETFAQKPNLRLLKSEKERSNLRNFKEVAGGLLVQTPPTLLSQEDFKIVTKQAPTAAQIQDLLFAAKVNYQVKSNSIVIAKDGASCGIGAGQMSRVDSTFMALYKAKENAKGAVLSSDGFFPFADSIELAARAGITAIIQPGGSKNDAEVIRACDQQGIAMVFTRKRLFKH